MSFLDAMVSRCFRDSEVGRAVIFPHDSRGCAYIVRSDYKTARNATRHSRDRLCDIDNIWSNLVLGWR
jgi:hypothetical protein